jgi:hypothetical protein
MANIKFSGFTEVTSISGVQEIVGYNGTQNVRITPANLLSSLPGGPFLPLAGGTMTGDLIINTTGGYFQVDVSDNSVKFADNTKAKFGTGSDLEIYHDTNNSIISSGTGDLYIQNTADDKDILFRADDGSGGVETYFFLDSSAGGPSPFTVFPDSSTLCLGTSYDLRQYHNGTDSYLDNYEGNLNLRNYADDKDIIFSSDDGSGGIAEYFRLDGSLATGSRVYTVFPDNSTAVFGSGFDFQIHHDASNTYLKQGGTGDLYFQQLVDDKDIVFQSDDGAGGVATYFFLDGSDVQTRFLKDLRFLDDVKLLIGNGNDLQIYHDGSNSYINEIGTGNLIIKSSPIIEMKGDNNEYLARFIENGSVDLYYNNSLKFETTSTGIDIIGGIKDSNGDLGTAGQVLSSTGTALDWIDAAGGGVEGNNSVYVVPSGTAAQNGASLLTGLTAAIAKISSVTVPGSNIAMVFYNGGFPPGQGNFEGTAQSSVTFSAGPQYSATFNPNDGGGSRTVLITVTSVGNQGPQSFGFNITESNGNPIQQINGSPNFPSPASTQLTPSTLIIAPGDYSIASDFILNNLVNVTSLTGQADVNISTSNVKIQSGANNSSYPISIVGLNLTTSLFIQSNLSSLTFKNCKALGTNSFSIEPSGTGSIAGTFEDCTGDFRSFGGGVGVTASGLFIRCKTTGNGAFGGKGSTSGYFEYCGGAIYDSSNFLGLFHQSFGLEGLTVNGYFYYCTGGTRSFASDNTGATGAEFYYCVAKNQSFAYRNTNNDAKFYNCVGGDQTFGSEPQGGDLAANAVYYNCSANNMARNAANSSSKFYNCHASVNWGGYNAGNNGLAYNCSFGSFGGQNAPSGTGKYRNCLDSTFTIVNQG